MPSTFAVPPNLDPLEELRKECDKNPKLKPLYNIVLGMQNGSQNADIFSELYQLVQSDEELISLYARKVDNELDTIGSKIVQLLSDGNKTKTGPFTKHYEKTGRVDGVEENSELNSVPKKPSFIYRDFVNLVAALGKESPDVIEGDGKPMVYLQDAVFENWGQTVKNIPSYTFTARTRVGVQNLVKWAIQVNKRVRVAGFRHTWGDMYADNGDIIVILLPLSTTIDLPSVLLYDHKSDLQGVDVTQTSDGQYLAKIAAGTTNDQFREWCFKNKTVTLPLNVIMIEITLGGSNAPICHGAGITTSTLSDLVAEVEYVDPLGNIQTVSDPTELKAAAGCFGLLGVVLSVTLRVDKMQKAVMQPHKLPVALAIPPPPGYPVPAWIDMSQYTQQQLDDAQKAFETAIETQYYVEWFWFPFQSEVWFNVWQRAEVTISEDLDAYPSNLQAALQWLEGFFAETINNWSVYQALPGWLQAFIFGTVGQSQMPDVPDPQNAIITYVSEALHFRRGIQNMRCLDSEWEIPIPATQDGQTRDFSVIQRAWWDGITAFYDNLDNCPMRVTFEMRITGSSEILMAPQRNNDFGTCSIEILTTLNPEKSQWQEYKQYMVDKWASYTDANGKLLNIRPHWAKEWQGLQVRGKDVIDYLREDAYADELPAFVDTLSSITSKRGSSLAETRTRFSNPLLEKVIFGA
ncbi:hypothetical protein D9757_008749 [Collybiopsis confluens]|uniref:FAD-binding PCMH-type domain-containing protein n=1 Tax=Collybiopsis confluens TaxID=2823264 RepID=A0A8H5LF48_9AGAR|nr:hypothetical protein D9757_013528 [Collybiopsis confluens]KAF5378934.1 hypothetical protein D9757_008749 [Collybiopsis confluens]